MYVCVYVRMSTWLPSIEDGAKALLQKLRADVDAFVPSSLPEAADRSEEGVQGRACQGDDRTDRRRTPSQVSPLLTLLKTEE